MKFQVLPCDFQCRVTLTNTVHPLGPQHLHTIVCPSWKATSCASPRASKSAGAACSYLGKAIRVPQMNVLYTLEHKLYIQPAKPVCRNLATFVWCGREKHGYVYYMVVCMHPVALQSMKGGWVRCRSGQLICHLHSRGLHISFSLKLNTIGSLCK